jgi:hypothetical protein
MSGGIELSGFVALAILPTLAVGIDLFIHLSARSALMMLTLWFYCLHLLWGSL